MADKADKKGPLIAQRDFMHKGKRATAGTAADDIKELSAENKRFLAGNGCLAEGKPAAPKADKADKADAKLPGA